jgi:predicted AlkP superfamily phosphohydrolase/phosphomutase
VLVDRGSRVQKPKLVVIGLDGASFTLVDRFVAAGLMPNLARLLARSASAPMTCTWPAHTAPGWASVVTGRLPGRHGIFQFFDTQDPDYGAVIVGSGDFGCSTVWDWLALQGWSAGLVNVPMSHPPRQDLPGFQITWPLTNTLAYAHPRSLLGELARGGVHFRSDLATMYRGEPDYIEEALASVRARLASFAYLLRARPVDAMMVVFTEIDRVCHHYYHLFDPDHPRYEPAPDGRQRAIERVHVEVDAALGELLAMLDEETTVVVVSDHGSGSGKMLYCVHRVLEREGLLATRPAGEASGEASWFTDRSVTIDWSRTSVYMPVPGCSALDLNLRGRQRHGTVASYDASRVLDEVAALLSAERDEEGNPVFSRILRREEAFPGTMSDRAPDLLLVPRDEATLVAPGLTGPVWQPSPQTGLHRHEGLWLQASPRIAAGRRQQPIRIVDVAPTMLADVGLSVPNDLDGHVVADAFMTAQERLRPLEVDEAASFVDRGVAGPEDASTSIRLRQMGYL